MLVHFLLFFLLLVLIYLITRGISANIYSAVFLLSNNRRLSLGVLTFFLLPGTIIHELSHFVFATLLGVKTGELSVIPELKHEDGEIKAGKLDIYGADPFRQLLIGFAPILSGLTIIFISADLFLPYLDFPNILNTKYIIQNILGVYFLFILSSTMFSSRKDLESAVIVLPIVGLSIYIFYRLGVKIVLDNSLISTMEKTVTVLNKYLLISAFTDYVILLLSQIAIYALERVLKRKIVRKKKN